MYALLIGINCYPTNRLSDGSSYGYLMGCVNDIERVATYLKNQRHVPSSQIIQLTASSHPQTWEPMEPADQLPTYANIVAKFQELTVIAPSGSQVYIHYCGHGGRAQTVYPALKGNVGGIDETLVPMDIGQTGGRYLRDVELGKLLQDMVTRGLVVTLVLDSCHSGGATRGSVVNVRGLAAIDFTPRSTESLVGTPEELMASWRSLGDTPESIGITRSLNATVTRFPHRNCVVLAACRPQELALEHIFEPETQQRHGVMSHWWMNLLEQQVVDCTYKDLLDRLHAHIHSQFPQQTPMLWGEGNRLVFGDALVEVKYSATVMQLEGDRVCLEVGQATGVRVGAIFAIYPNGTVAFDSRQRLATVKIESLGATEAWGRGEAAEKIRPGDVAVLVSTMNLIKQVQWAGKEKESIAPLLRATGWLEFTTENGDYSVSVNDEGEYEVMNHATEVILNLRPIWRIESDYSEQLILEQLIHVAKYQAVQDLDNFDRNSPLMGKLSVAWIGKLKQYDPVDSLPSQLEPLDQNECPTLQTNEWIFLQIRNEATIALNVAVLALGANWQIVQVHPFEVGAKFVVIEAGGSETVALQLSLPEGYEEGVDIAKVFATVGSPNFRWLELPPLGQSLVTKDTTTRGADPLDELLATIASDRPTRSLNPAQSASREWTTQQVSVTVRRN
jgi:Caspase domain